MNTIVIDHIDGDRFSIGTRGHVVTVDQPLADGGTDTAPTPTELFVAGLGACVAFYAHRYLVRHNLPTAGLQVRVSFEMAARPARVSEIVVSLQLPDNVPVDRRQALLAVASHCTVHNTLLDPPDVTVVLRDEEAAA